MFPQNPLHESAVSHLEPVGTRSESGADGRGGGRTTRETGEAQDPDRTLLGDDEVAFARRIFGAWQSQSGCRSQPGALRLQLETGVGGGRTGKASDRAANFPAWRRARFSGTGHLGTNRGRSDANAEGMAASLGRHRNSSGTCMKTHAVFHTGSKVRAPIQRQRRDIFVEHPPAKNHKLRRSDIGQYAAPDGALENPPMRATKIPRLRRSGWPLLGDGRRP